VVVDVGETEYKIAKKFKKDRVVFVKKILRRCLYQFVLFKEIAISKSNKLHISYSVWLGFYFTGRRWS